MGKPNRLQGTNIHELYNKGLNDHERRMGLISSCWLCGSSRFISVHHIDGNPKNNDISNLLVVCTKCHAKFHNWGANGFKKGNTLWKKKKEVKDKWNSKVN